VPSTNQVTGMAAHAARHNDNPGAARTAMPSSQDQQNRADLARRRRHQP
jgi:hypothetical protein